MRHYELVVVLSPILNQDESADTWDRIKGFISNREAEITHEEKWGTRRLAYPIRKGQYQFLEGAYHLTRFSTDEPFNRELESFLRLEEQVLRSLVVVAQPSQVLSPGVPAEPVAEAEAPVAELETVSADAEATLVVEEPVDEVVEAPAADTEEPVDEVVEAPAADTEEPVDEVVEVPAADTEEPVDEEEPGPGPAAPSENDRA